MFAARCLLQRSRAWTQKKELVDMNSIISQHTNPGRSHRQMQQDRGGLAKLSRSTTLLPRLKSGILGLGAPDRLGCCLAKPDSFSVRFHAYMPYLSNSAQKRSVNQPDSLRGGRMGGPGGWVPIWVTMEQGFQVRSGWPGWARRDWMGWSWMGWLLHRLKLALKCCGFLADILS